MADMIAGDVMVAAPRMDLLDIDAPYDELLAVVIDTGHSRFPVYEGERDNIIGILLAKDLLKLQRAPELNLRTLLRPAVFVPESQGPERPAARLSRQPQPPGDRDRRVRQHRRPDHHRGRARRDRRRDRGRVRRDRRTTSDIYTLADGTQRVAGDTDIGAVNEALRRAAARRRLRHHRRPGRARAWAACRGAARRWWSAACRSR